MQPTLTNSSIAHEHSLNGEKLSLLAVFARPEDESFGPAGTLAKYASEGVQVTLVTATRLAHRPDDAIVISPADGTLYPRDRSCSCRASGIRRACLLDSHPGELDRIAPEIIEERLVRLIREIQPQVVITLGPGGITGGSDYAVLSRVTTDAFRDAGDSTKFQRHFHDGLGAYAPQKLYYCVLPQSVVTRWGMSGFTSFPDDQITSVLDVSAYGEAMKNALYCQRSHAFDFIRWLTEEQRLDWESEYYALVESRLNKKAHREKDLFAGLR